ncbi:glycine zipper domain-containing protein [Paraburkholderia phymatum]|uniref:Glycine zipper domain-containing protein n=1 Tax=Paraburkholderia phymatum TaxID=148447 RepID=A0ACC6TWS1_9BURK
MNALRIYHISAIAALLCYQTLAQAQPVAYPAKGQSAQKQQQDEGQCASWAKSKTGIDPTAVAATPPPPSGPAVGGGERVGGAARGAAGGAVIGAIAGDAGKGAAVGAVAGTMGGGMRARQNQRNAQANAEAQKQNAMGAWNQAYSACMSGRGYTMH